MKSRSVTYVHKINTQTAHTHMYRGGAFHSLSVWRADVTL